MTEAQDQSGAPQPGAEASHAGHRKVHVGVWVAILALALVVCVIAGVVVGLNILKSPPPRQDSPTVDAYSDAMGLFLAGDHSKALKAFRQVRRDWPGTIESRKAQILIRCAQAQMAAKAEDGPTLERKSATARDLLEEAAETDDLGEWARGVLAKGAYLPSLDIATAEAEQVLREVRRRVAAGQYLGAEAYLEQRLPGVRFSQQQQANLAAVRQDLNQRKATAEVDSTLRTAKQMTDAGRFDRAAAAYTAAESALDTSTQRGHLPPGEAQRLEMSLEEGRSVLGSLRALAEAVDKAETARSESQLAAEKAALDTAIAAAKLVDKARLPALTERLATVETELAFSAALAQARQEPDPKLADDILRKFIAAYPEHAEAATALKALQTDRKWGQLIAEGDQAVREGRWDEARLKYKSAAEIKKDPALETRHRRAEYEIIMQQARRARDEKRYEDARSAAENAAKVYVQAAQAVQAWRDDVARQEKYEADLLQATAALRAGNLEGAGQILAQVIPQTNKVLAMRDEIAFRRHMELGKAAMSGGDYAAACEAFRQAQKHATPGQEIAPGRQIAQPGRGAQGDANTQGPARTGCRSRARGQQGIGPTVRFPQPTFAPRSNSGYGYFPVPLGGGVWYQPIGTGTRATGASARRRPRMLPGPIRATHAPRRTTKKP